MFSHPTLGEDIG
jgi:hypothetical protein